MDKSIIIQGKDYINEAEEMKELIKRLRNLREEKSGKKQELHSMNKIDIGEQTNDREH